MGFGADDPFGNGIFQLESAVTAAPGTIVKYRGIFAELMKSWKRLTSRALAEFTAPHFDKYRAWCKVNHSLKTVYTESVVIKQILRRAKRCKLVLENPIEDIKLYKPKMEPKGGPGLEEIDHPGQQPREASCDACIARLHGRPIRAVVRGGR